MKLNPLFTRIKPILLLALVGSFAALSGCSEEMEREHHRHHDGRYDRRHDRGYDDRDRAGVSVRSTTYRSTGAYDDGYNTGRGYDDGYGRRSSTVVVSPGATVRRERVVTY